jgi:hypothetical protein
MNEFDVIQVEADLIKKGYHDYRLQEGNQCIWTSVRSGFMWLDFYYVFRDGQIADIQVG